MYDSAFSQRNLRETLRVRDFSKNTTLHSPAGIDAISKQALTRVDTGFDTSVPINKFKHRKKTIIQFEHLADELVSRKLSQNIRQLTRSIQSDRNIIVGDLISLLHENIDSRVYKLDISSFYESISTQSILKEMKIDASISRPTFRLLSTLLEITFVHQGINGLPRGISLSATLSEYYMRHFDYFIRKDPNIFYYKRFVDDIIIITSGYENDISFIKSMENKLPDGLSLNSKKTAITNLEFRKKNHGLNLGTFDYLGYEFSVLNPIAQEKERSVEIDISTKKTKRIKSRISLSIVSFLKNKDFYLLEKRIKFLTSNHTIYDPETDILRLAGIFYNYRHANIKIDNKLDELDCFLKNSILGSKTKLSKRVNLSRNNISKILKYSFKRGFNEKIIYSFSHSEINQITKCWNHE